MTPNFDEIDQAYNRRKPPPDPAMDGYKKFVTMPSAVIAGAFVIISITGALSAAADNVFALGWGLHWRDFWVCLAAAAVGATLYALMRVWFAFIGFYELSSKRRQ